MKKILQTIKKVSLRNVLFLIIMISSFVGMAQVAMVRTTFNAPFVPINSGASNGGTLSTAAGDDVFQAGIPIGFSFNYLGNNYSNITVSTNGWASFATGLTSSTASNAELYSSFAPALALAPWWDDLASDSIVYRTTGTPGSLVFTIQWNSKAYWSATQRIVYQVKLFEGSNIIEFHYGSVIPGSSATAESASIGIKNAAGGAGNYIDAVTGSSQVGNGFMTSTTKWPTRFYRFSPGTPSVISGGTYNVGTGQTYPTLDEAVADLNHRGVSGPVTMALTQSVYNVDPAGGDNIFPVFIGNVPGASTTNSILIQSAAATSTLAYDGASGGFGASGSTNAFGTANEPIVGLVGASFVTINNIFLTNLTPSVSLIDRGLAIINQSAGVGSFSNTVRSVTVSLNRSSTSSLGFEIRAANSPSASSGANSFNSFIDVGVRNVYNGVLFSGNATWPDLGNRITTSLPSLWNTIGGSNANDIGNGTTASYGIQAFAQSSLDISNNLIQNITVSGTILSDGILTSGLQGTSLIYNNIIQNVRNNSTTSTGAITGIRSSVATTGTHEIRIYNNFVSGLTSAYTGALSATRQIKGIFAQAAGGGTASQTINVIANNVAIDGSGSPNISSTAYEIGTSSGVLINTRNNIFANLTVAQTSPAQHLTWVSTSNTLVGNTGSTSNFNDLFILNTTEGYVGRGSTATYSTLAAWQTAMNQDANSISCNPGFVGANDLHVSALCLDGAGGLTGYPWLTTDIDNTPRSSPPDIGADEFQVCSAVNGGNVTNANINLCIGQGTIISSSGVTVAGGVSYFWQTATVAGGPYVAATGSGSTSVSYNTGVLNAGTYYYRLVATCAANSATAASNEVTVTVNPNPVLSFNSNTFSVCSPGGSAAAITASGATTYSWAPSIGLNVTSGASVQAFPSVLTIYTVTGTSLGCNSTSTVSVNALSSPVLNVISASPTLICSGSNSNLNVTGFNPGLVNTYGFSTSSSANLLSLNTPTTLVNSAVDDTPSAVFNIGFTFNFNGTNYSQFSASPDGWILLGSGNPSSQWVNQVTNTTNIPKIYPYWDDIHTGTNGSVRAELQGVAPNRMLIVQWFVTIPSNFSGTANSNFQAILYEASGNVEFRYGSMGTSASASGGLTGGSTNYQSLTFSSAVSSTTTSNDLNSSPPASGTSYLFTPPVPVIQWSPATYLSSSSVSSPTALGVANAITYTVNLTSPQACVTSSVVSIQVNASPTLSVNSATICSGNSFTISPSGAVSYSYAPAGPVVTPTANSTYTITGQAANGCEAAIVSTVSVNATPTLVASASSATICNGSSTQLSVSGANSYTWSSGANASTVSVSPSVSTTYTVTGAILGCVATETVDVTVNALPLVTVNSGSICSGDSFTLSPSGAVSYSYLPNGPVVSPTSNSSFTVTGSDANGCSASVISSVSVTASPSLVLTASSNTICEGSSVTLNAIGANSYTWSTGVNTNSASVSPSLTSTYSVTGENSGCVSSETVSIVVNSLPSVSLLSSANEACLNTSPIALTASPSGGTFSGTNVSGSSFNPVSTGSFTPSYSYTDAVTGCSDTQTVSIVVNPNPTVTMSPPATNFCTNGSIVALNGLPSGGVYTGANVSNGTFNPGSAPGNYTVNYSYSDPLTGCSDQTTLTMTVNVGTTATLTAASSTICAGGGTVALTGLPSGGVYSGTGVSSGAFTAPASQGTYTAVYSYTDSVSGCYSSDNVSIVVSVCTGLESQFAYSASLQVYPNPNTGKFTIELNNGLSKSIIVTDLTGRVIYTETSVEDKIVLSMNDVANGVYLVKVISSNKTDIVRVIKQ
jgi:hypothetical protein